MPKNDQPVPVLLSLLTLMKGGVMLLMMAWGGVFSLSAFDAEGMRMDGIMVER